MNNFKKRVLVSGYIGFSNFGDEAIFYALSKHLKMLNYKTSVLCNNPLKVSAEYGVEAFYYKNLINVFSSILKNDILISGGGSLLQNKTSNFSLFYYLFVIFSAKLFFKKVIIFSQGIEPINGKFPLFLTKMILNGVKFISVRDLKSQKLLEKYKIKSDLTSDPVYSLVEEIKPSFQKKGLLIQLREFNNINEKFIDDLAKSVFKNYSKTDISVFSFQDEYDKKICEKFIEKLAKFNLKAQLICNKTINETINIINDHEFMLSARLHGLIVSNALKTKTFALSYDEKIKTLSEELKIENIDIFNYKNDELNLKLNNFFNSNNVNPPVLYRKFDWSVLDGYLSKV